MKDGRASARTVDEKALTRCYETEKHSPNRSVRRCANGGFHVFTENVRADIERRSYREWQVIGHPRFLKEASPTRCDENAQGAGPAQGGEASDAREEPEAEEFEADYGGPEDSGSAAPEEEEVRSPSLVVLREAGDASASTDPPVSVEQRRVFFEAARQRHVEQQQRAMPPRSSALRPPRPPPPGVAEVERRVLIDEGRNETVHYDLSNRLGATEKVEKEIHAGTVRHGQDGKLVAAHYSDGELQWVPFRREDASGREVRSWPKPRDVPCVIRAACRA